MSASVLCIPLRPSGLPTAIRLVVIDGLTDDVSEDATADLAIQGAVEEALGEATLSNEVSRGGLTLSVASCDGHAAGVAAAGRMRIGVAIERDGRITAAHERFFLTPAERRVARMLGHTTLWTLKDAAWKALVPGLVGPNADVDLELLFGPRGDVRLARVAGVAVTMRAVIVQPWSGYVVATVWSELPASLRRRAVGARSTR